MRETILGIAFVFTIVSGVFGESQDNVIAGSMMAGTRVTSKILPGQKQLNSTEIILALENRGNLVDGLINKQLPHSPALKAAFKKVRGMTAQSKCKVFSDLSMVVTRICPVKTDNASKVEGEFTSNVRILKVTNFFNNERRIDFTLSLMYSVKMHDNKKYIRCSVEKPQPINKKKEKSGKVFDTKTEITQLDGLGSKEHKKRNKTKDPIYEFMMTNQQDITVVYLKKPYFLRVILTRDPHTDNETHCHSLDKQNESEVIVKTKKCNSDELLNNLKTTRKLDKSVNLTYEDLQEERRHSLLMYDSRVHENPLDNIEQIRANGRDPRYLQLLVSSEDDIPSKVSIQQLSDGKLFAFDFSNDKTAKIPSSRELVVFIEDTEEEKKKNLESAGATPENNTVKEKNISELVKTKVKTAKQANNGEYLSSQKEALDWTMNNESPIKHISTKNQEAQPVPKPCFSNQVTCGLLAIEMTQEKNLSSPMSNVFNDMTVFMVLKTKKTLNENGQEIGPKDENEERFLKRQLPMNKYETTAYEMLVQMNPKFEKHIGKAVADIKKTITNRFGSNVWKTYTYTSELLIVRRLSCSSMTCTGSIRAMLEYNMTRKEKPSTILNRQLPVYPHKPSRQMSLRKHKLFLIMTGRIVVKQQQNTSPTYQYQPMIKIKNIASKIKAHSGKMRSSTAKPPHRFVFPKLFFKPATRGTSGDSKFKESDEFSKLHRMRNSHDFKVNKKHLAKDDKVDRLIQAISNGLKGYSQERSNKERLLLLKALASKTNSGSTAGVGMCILVAFLNALLILKQ